MATFAPDTCTRSWNTFWLTLDAAKSDRTRTGDFDRLHAAMVAYRNSGRKINGHSWTVMADALNDWECA